MVGQGFIIYRSVLMTPLASALVLGLILWAAGPARSLALEKAETRISGRVLAADTGRPMAGVVAIEKGRLYGKDFKYGGRVDEDGHFSVVVPSGGDYGLHVYATGHIYFPVGIEVEDGVDNSFDVKVPPNQAADHAPQISEVKFVPGAKGGTTFTIELSVNDPDEDLSHQVLAVNTRTFEGFILKPRQWVFLWTRNYPNGIYSLKYDTGGDSFYPEEWLFVAADNRCYNSAVLGHPFDTTGQVNAESAYQEVESLGGEALGQRSVEKLSEETLFNLGESTFKDNCGICHKAESEKTIVGPGLKGLYKKKLTPVRKRPVNDETITDQIKNGGEGMPPYSHVRGDALQGLLLYLKSL